MYDIGGRWGQTKYEKLGLLLYKNCKSERQAGYYKEEILIYLNTRL